MYRTLFVCMLAVSSCGLFTSHKDSFLPEREDVSAFKTKADILWSRLRDRFTVGGMVVSRLNGKPHHIGDSLIWTGLKMGVEPCTEGRTTDALDQMVEEYQTFVRFSPLPQEFKGDEVSWDGVLGVVFGAALRKSRCGGEFPIRRALAAHAHSVALNGGRLYDGGQLLPPGQDYSWFLLMSQIGVFHTPTHRSSLDMTSAGWVMGVAIKRAACFRIHLATLALMSAELMGDPIKMSFTKSAYCGATAGVGLPLTDIICGRLSGWEYLNHYQLNVYEYEHQRCKAFETEASYPELETPGLDFLLVYTLLGGML